MTPSQPSLQPFAQVIQLSNRIGSIAQLLRDALDFREADEAILALTLLRRMDSGNHFSHLAQQPDQTAQNLRDFIVATSGAMKPVLDVLFAGWMQRLDRMHVLDTLVREFADIDLHPDRVDARTMGAVFDNLMMRSMTHSREFEVHATPPDVAQLVVQLLMEPDRNALSKVIAKSGDNACEVATFSICDPACGVGQMLVQAQNWLLAVNDKASLAVYGNDKFIGAWAMASAARYMHGAGGEEIARQMQCADTLVHPPFSGQVFDYLVTIPPFNVPWTDSQLIWQAKSEFFQKTGLSPGGNDAALAFLLYLVEKFASFVPGDASRRGTRAVIVLNAAPLRSGAPGSGDSGIRRWLIEHDYLEAVVALPMGVLYNMATFACVLSNRKSEARKGKIQLIDARDQGTPLRGRAGSRQHEVSPAMLKRVIEDYVSMASSDTSRLFDGLEFGYRRILLMRPLRLRFQMTTTAKATFLNTCPELLDAVIALEAVFGDTAHDDWSQVWGEVLRQVKLHGGWRAGRHGTGQKKLLRQIFTTVSPNAKPVLARSVHVDADILPALFPQQGSVLAASGKTLPEVCGLLERNGKWLSYEPDPALRDWIDIPLGKPVLAYFLQEIAPFAPDAWIDPSFRDERDGGIGKVGYAIDFQKHFPPHQEVKSLAEIDVALAEAKSRLLSLLQGETP